MAQQRMLAPHGTNPIKGQFFNNRDLFLMIGLLLIEQFLSILTGLVDSMMVAHVGEAAYILAVSFNLGVLGVWLAMVVDWAFRASLFTWRYFSGKWQNFRAV